ncbi:bactofilin family protein [Rhodocaloribacter sp.]
MLFLLAAVTTSWLFLALAPALVELWLRRDAASPTLSDEYEEDLRRAAARFEARMRPHLDTLREAGDAAPPAPGVHLLRTETDVHSARTAHPPAPYLLSPARAWRLPPRFILDRELYAPKALHGGPDSDFFALFGEEEIDLGPGSVVRRWLHGKGRVTAARGTRLHGNASSERALHLAAGCAFERLHAPVIVFGEAGPATPAVRVRGERILYRPRGCFHETAARTYVNGDLDVPARHRLEGNVVVTGRLRIGAGAHLTGSLKAHGDVLTAEDVIIDGNVFAGGDVRLGARGLVRGVVSAEGALVVETGARLGSPERPTTVSGRHVRIATGVRAHGVVWALEAGSVTEAPHRTARRGRPHGEAHPDADAAPHVRRETPVITETAETGRYGP